jgi:hypothetical protein
MSAPTIAHRPGSWVGWLALVLVLTLVGCATAPSVAVGPGSSPMEARRLLLTTATQGAVPLVIDRAPELLSPAETAELAQTGASDWTAVAFEPISPAEPAEGVRLVFRFDDTGSSDPGEVCAQATGPSLPAPPPARLLAVFCDGTRPVADAFGVATGTERRHVANLVIETTRAIFPGDRYESYGYPGVNVFGGVGIGSGRRGGIGVGLGF